MDDWSFLSQYLLNNAESRTYERKCWKKHIFFVFGLIIWSWVIFEIHTEETPRLGLNKFDNVQNNFICEYNNID